MLIIRKKYHGFTLTEVMIALVINLILFAALITIFVANIEHYNKMLSISTLNEQLQSAMQFMTSEIRRAGYWANAQNDVGLQQNTNPYMAAGADIATYSSGSCILFSYDRNSDGTLPGISSTYDDERYGFRLNGNAIQTRSPGAAFDCNAASNAWENITDPTIITVSNLNFALNQTSISIGVSSSLVIRSVDITITGSLASDATISRTITEHVRIRNDKFVP